MAEALLRHSRFYALQNGLAAAFFACLLGAELIRHLLTAFPASEMLWRLTVLCNRSVGPLLDIASTILGAPAFMLVLLAAMITVPLVAWRRRHWLATAISGHVALASVVFLAVWSMRYNHPGYRVASLTDVFHPRLFNFGTFGLIGLILVMAGFCILNHLAFFQSARPRSIHA